MATNYWSGDKAKFLLDKIELKGGSQWLTLTADPTAVATDAPQNSYGVFSGDLFIKQDNGSTTNWNKVGDNTATQLTGVYLDLDNIAYGGLPSGSYYIQDTGANLSNTPWTTVPAAIYTIGFRISNGGGLFFEEITVTSNGDWLNINRRWMRSGPSFASAITIGWDEILSGDFNLYEVPIYGQYGAEGNAKFTYDTVAEEFKANGFTVNDDFARITDRDGTRVIDRNYNIFWEERFKETDPTIFLTAGGGVVITEETTNPISGARSANIDLSGASVNDTITSQQIDLTGLTNGEEYGREIALVHKVANGVAGAITHKLQVFDGSWSDYTDGELSRNGNYEITHFMKLDSSVTAIRIQDTVSIVGATDIIYDAFALDLDPFEYADLSTIEHHNILGSNSYGSTATKIPAGGTLTSTGNRFLDVVSDPVNGISATVLEDCYVIGNWSDNFNGTEYFGFTLNNNNVTTGFLALAGDTTLSQGQNSGANAGENVTFATNLKKGDVVRPHTQSNNANWIANVRKIRFTAMKMNTAVIVSGKTSALDTNSYTPTFQGFGTPSDVNALWSQVGDKVYVTVEFESGSPSATEARVGLPNGYTIKGGTLKTIGTWFRSTTGTSEKGGAVTVSDGNDYFTFSSREVFSGSIGTPHSAANGINVASVASDKISFTAMVPVNELSASDVIYAVGVGDLVENDYWMEVGDFGDASGVVTVHNYSTDDWYQSVSYNGGTGEYTITLTPNFFSVPPMAQATFRSETGSPSNTGVSQILSATTTEIKYASLNNVSGVVTSARVMVEVSRGTTDRREPMLALVGQNTGVNVTSTEKLTGRRINGKPEYIIEATGSFNTGDIIASGVERITSFSGDAGISGDRYQIPFYGGVTAFGYIELSDDTLRIDLSTPLDCNIIATYTKL